jgi:hypothetical protein
MPTTITSAGITFNDATSLTSANIGTAQLVNGSVIASKLGTNEQKQICKAWVNFDGTTLGGGNAASGFSITVNSGSNTGTWSQSSSSWTSNYIGQIFYITSIGGVSGATLGGVNVSTSGIQIISVSGTSATFRLLGGNATSSQTIAGNGTSSGFTYITYGIRSSYNVSSVTKNGTGDYTVNFATPMTDANYASLITSTYGSSNNLIAPKTGSGIRVSTYVTTSGGNQDQTQVSVAIFGN